jgi:signal peptidase I
MKKWLKYIGIFVGGYLVATIVIGIGSAVYEKPNNFYQITVKGDSMLPTLRSGQSIQIDTSTNPKINDIISFRCKSLKCGIEYQKSLTKRLSKSENNCFFFLGDNLKESFDSRDFGWLCGDEIEIEGVVVK